MIDAIMIALGVAVLVAWHELGHMLAAKLFGVTVNEFAVGFGPTIISFKMGSVTRYSLRLLPLGGYVSLKGGENPSNRALKNGFFTASWWRRCLIVLAGPAFNFVLALGLLWGVLLVAKGFSALEALRKAAEMLWSVVTLMTAWLGSVLGSSECAKMLPAPASSTDVLGPLGTVTLLRTAAHEGVASLLFLLSMLSASLGFFNLLPIPGLDGGHLPLYLFEGISRRRVPTVFYRWWSVVGFFLLLGVVALTLWLDVSRLFLKR